LTGTAMGEQHRNLWRDDRTARAFWSQQEASAYKRLLRDTIDWASPAAGEIWLDLGCGGGALTAAIWKRSGGSVSRIVGIDVAEANASAYDMLRETLQPSPGGRVAFVHRDFSEGLPLPDAAVDHAVSGLAIMYAESWSESEKRWTQDAYDRILREVHRVLRPGGRFVFSVNVPEPAWWRVAMTSLGGIAASPDPLRFLRRSYRMLEYGRWLKQQARIGRFHYLPVDTVAGKLRAAGFEHVEHRLSYAGQAYVIRCTRPDSGGMSGR
jgi:ubiquinone/menaquinone biosynthesis C-methylase UbiE